MLRSRFRRATVITMDKVSKKKRDGRASNGAKPSGPNGEHRKLDVRMRCSESEKRQVEAAADFQGVTVSDLLRKALGLIPHSSSSAANGPLP